MNAPEKNLAAVKFQTAPHFPIYMDYSATTPIDPRVASVKQTLPQEGVRVSEDPALQWTI